MIIKLIDATREVVRESRQVNLGEFHTIRKIEDI